MATVDYLSVIKTAEAFTDDQTPWDQKFADVISKSIKDQADAFKLRFALQFEKQGLDVKQLVKKVNAAAEMFEEKAKSGNGKSLKYGGVEFGDILKEFAEVQAMSFVERKSAFKDFDLDTNGYVDLIEFLLYLHKDTVEEGFKQRHGVTEITIENKAEPLMQELVNIAVFVDPKLDEQILGLAKLKEEFEADMRGIRDDAKTEIKKRQLTNNLKAREAKYEEDKKSFFDNTKIGKAKQKLLKNQEKHLRDLEALIDQEEKDALAPKKNLKKP